MGPAWLQPSLEASAPSDAPGRLTGHKPTDRHVLSCCAGLYDVDMEKRAHLRWKSGLEFEAESDDGVRVRLDGGKSSNGFRPAALMLAALAGCTGMDAISIMTKKRLRIDSYEVEVVGQQRDALPRTFTDILVMHVIKGRDVEDEAVARSIELTARRYCTVGATIAGGDTVIRHQFQITDEAGERSCDCVTIGPNGAGLAVRETV